METKNLRKNTIIVIAILLLSVSKLSAQYNGTFGMGAHLNYGSEIQRPGVGLDIHYYITNNIRIAPSLTYYMAIKDKSMWSIDGDFHYVVPVGPEFSFYPIAGLHYSEWKNRSEMAKIDNNDIYNKRLGLNVGLGFQYDFRYKTRTSLEIKYQSIKDYSQVGIMLGIGFWI